MTESRKKRSYKVIKQTVVALTDLREPVKTKACSMLRLTALESEVKLLPVWASSNLSANTEQLTYCVYKQGALQHRRKKTTPEVPGSKMYPDAEDLRWESWGHIEIKKT